MVKKEEYIWSFLRIGLGWIFLWSFLDKLFGLGFATAADKSWLLGNSPTFGFLKFGTTGIFASFFQSLSNFAAVIDWIFMLGLLLIGTALILGVTRKLACYSAVLLLSLMWLAVVPPEHNPVIDEHIIYILALLGLVNSNLGNAFSLRKWWNSTRLAKKYKILRD